MLELQVTQTRHHLSILDEQLLCKFFELYGMKTFENFSFWQVLQTLYTLKDFKNAKIEFYDIYLLLMSQFY